ncbi:MAG TPA: single-stranded DNA-binding protein [Cytophagales bacterium]|nr:single-stranded DNA-binding protein [Cytophagales bacterium]HAA23425.1 single-stranded DNA-binding protein [Cytophagales bacterium]HAP58620.1 single-stranded DNA-binding protein [Cytophagales bacterium]
MAGINKVILIGNLGADPEVRHLESGSSVANFNIATTERYTDRNGQRQEATEWHRCELWNQQAKVAEQYLRKGSKIYLEGKLRTEQWTDQNGQTRYTTKIRGLSMQMLDGRPEGGGGNFQGGGGGGYQQAPPAAPPAGNPVPSAPPAQNFQVPEQEVDDLPF